MTTNAVRKEARLREGDKSSLNAKVAAHAEFLSDRQSGVASALQSALCTLLQQDLLPDNPFYFLANVLTAYHDRASSWSDPAAQLLRELDASLPVMRESRRSVCTLASFQHAFGLPHVLRCVDSSGLEAVHHVLVHNLHNSFFNSPAPIQSASSALVTRIMCSVQGTALMYSPQRQLPPPIRIRADVLISSVSTEDALDAFGTIILRESRDVQQLPLNTLVSIRAVQPATASLESEASQAKGVARACMSKQQIEASPAAFLQLVKRAVLSFMVLEAEYVLVAEMQAQARDAASDGEASRASLCSAIKTYHLHVQKVQQASGNAFVDAAALTHYGGVPYEALYSGVFLDDAALQAYVSMYEAEVGPPYAEAIRGANEEVLVHKVVAGFDAGRQLDGLLHLAMYSLLQANEIAAGVADEVPLLPLEEQCARSEGAESLWLKVVPDVCRVMHSVVSRLTRMVASLRCLRATLERLPELQASTANPPLNSANLSGAAVLPAERFDASRVLATIVTSLQTRIRSALASNAFSGLSIRGALLLQQLPCTAQSLENPQLLSAHCRTAHQLSLLLDAAAMSAADAMSFRPPHLADVLATFDLHPSWTALSAGFEGGAVFPSWNLVMQESSSKQVSAGSLPKTLALEGVRMRYLTDARVDQLLAAVYADITAPPLLQNPLGRVVSMVRQFGCRLEAGNSDEAELRRCSENNLVRIGPPGSFIYAGHGRVRSRVGRSRKTAQSASATARSGSSGGHAMRQHSDVDAQQPAVFGTAPAVQLADCTMLHRLAEPLHPLLSGADIQQGAVEIVKTCAILGSADISGCLDLQNAYEVGLLFQQLQQGDQRVTCWQAHHSPRFSHAHIEHAYYVSGPDLDEAAAAVVDTVLDNLTLLLKVGDEVVKFEALRSGRDAIAQKLQDRVRAALKHSSLTPATAQSLVTRASIFASMRSETYLPVTLDVKADWVQPKSLANSVAPDARCGPRSKRTDSEPHDDAAFERLFLSEHDAMVWWSHHRHRGHPSQPYHFLPYQSRLRKQAERLIRESADFVAALRLLTQAAKAGGDVGAALQLGRSQASHAQELACLCKQLHSLRLLLTETSPTFISAKAPQMVLAFLRHVLSTVHRYMISVKHCFSSGVRQAVLGRLDVLWERAQSSFGVTATEVQSLVEIELLLQCCEAGVGADLYLSMPREALDAIGAPKVSYLGTLEAG